MQIHELSITPKKKKRIGRGGKRGTYSGRGMKGQKARSGGNVDPLFEGGRTTLIQKMKKNRGFKSPYAKKNVISLAVLEKNYADGEIVSFATLAEKGIVKGNKLNNGARIVANGTLTKKLSIIGGVQATQLAQTLIEKVGGTVEIIAKKEKKEKKKMKK